MPLDPARTVAELAELEGLTPGGRLAWTSDWELARDWLTAKAADTGATMELDEAGNQWLTVSGSSEATLVVGGHLDTGSGTATGTEPLGLVAGLEVLRRLAADEQRGATVKLVSWADSEGERFGRPLLGATFARWQSRHQGMDVEPLVDRDGIPFADAAAAFGVDALAASKLARRQLRTVAACVELVARPAASKAGLAITEGTLGMERCRVTWRGDAAHTGATRFAPRVAELAGSATDLGAPTSHEAIQLVDQRHPDAAGLERLLEQALDASDEIARAERLEATWERLWHIDPVLFDPDFVALADDAVRDAGAEPRRLEWTDPSDVSELARTGVPSVLLVLEGAAGPEPVELAVRALDALVSRVLAQIDARA